MKQYLIRITCDGCPNQLEIASLRLATEHPEWRVKRNGRDFCPDCLVKKEALRRSKIADNSRKYYLKNKDAFKERSSKYFNEHRDRIRNYRILYRKMNLEKVRDWDRESQRRHRKKSL